jgi:hypothetical protein
MRVLLRTVFEEGQRLADSEVPDFHDYISCPTTVAAAFKLQAKEARLDDFSNVLPAAMKLGGGMSCDGGKKERTGCKFYDLSFTISDGKLGKPATVQLTNRTLFVAEHAPGRGDNAVAIRQTLHATLADQFPAVTLEALNMSFTFITDWAAMMPCVVGA